MQNRCYLGIADDDDTKSRPSQRNVQTSRVVKKPDTLVFIGPHTRQHDEVFLSTLERVDARHLNLLQTTTCFSHQKHTSSTQLLANCYNIQINQQATSTTAINMKHFTFHYVTTQLNFAALNRGRHLCSAGRPSRWTLAHILVLSYIADKHVKIWTGLKWKLHNFFKKY